MPEPTATPDQPAIEDQDDPRLAAQQWVRQLRAFYAHAGVAAASLTIIFAVNLATNLTAGLTGEWSAWWSVWAFLGWTPGLAVHGLVVGLQRPKPATSSWGQNRSTRCSPDEFRLHQRSVDLSTCDATCGDT